VYIIARARLGERDVNRLRDYALAHVKKLLELEPREAPTERSVRRSSRHVRPTLKHQMLREGPFLGAVASTNPR
jgi:hypothetical protein